MPHPTILYDGVCGLCNRWVQFVLRRDRDAIFRFAALQSPIAASILARHHLEPSELNTIYVVRDHDASSETLLSHSEAALFVLSTLPGPWRSLATLARLIPLSIRDWTYDFIARHRYQVFGRYDTCPIPSLETRARFLDQ